MKLRSWIGVGTMASMLLVGSVSVVAQQGPAEKLGEKLDSIGKKVKKGVNEVADDVRTQFAKTRDSVNSWGVESRVYGRLHWDSALNGSNLETHVDRDGAATLMGAVPDEAARLKAITLTRDTVGVTKVVDRLTIGKVKKITTTTETITTP
jgi:osmotically-inducible protein OsmY